MWKSMLSLLRGGIWTAQPAEIPTNLDDFLTLTQELSILPKLLYHALALRKVEELENDTLKSIQ